MPLLYALKTFHATKEKTKQNNSLQQMLFAETAATTIAFNHHLILTFPAVPASPFSPLLSVSTFVSYDSNDKVKMNAHV